MRHFLKIAKVGAPTQCLHGSLWKLEITPRALLEESIRLWASLASIPRPEAA